MTEQQKKKTLGLAVASLVCGFFFLIPILGLLLGIVAIILGIVALVKISNNKERYSGKGMAIAGIVMGGLSVVIIPIIALMAAIAIPNFLRARLSANDALAQSNLRLLSTACETYATANNGQYPLSVNDLTGGDMPYIGDSYCYETVSGFTYDCKFSSDGYIFTAEPVEKGVSGSTTFTITTEGLLTQENPI